MYAQNPFTKTKKAAVGAMTLAVKAQMLLLQAGVPATVVQLDPTETRRGCAYGVEFAAVNELTVRATLRAARISVSQYIDGGDKL